MPYDGELASKVAHSDIVDNPDVAAFLADCNYLRPPSDEEASAVSARFIEPPPLLFDPPVENIVATDGSWYETSLDERLPSTKVGYLKVGCVLIRLSEYGALRVRGGRYVDPFRVARLEERNWPLAFTLPSANVQWRGEASVRASFRAALDLQLVDPKTRFVRSDAASSLRGTLFCLASLRRGPLATGNPQALKLHQCPTCGADGITLLDVEGPQRCSQCDRSVFPADSLRVWEEVEEHQSNGTAIGRTMLAIEHMLPIHYMRFLLEHSPQSLSGMVFFVDGPLAIFGTTAWLHAVILSFLWDTNQRLISLGLRPVLVIGIQKTGQIVDSMAMIDRFIPRNRLLALDDEYRYRYCITGREEATKGFGENTYYGQDFIYKTPTGRTFVFAIPYPCREKSTFPGFAHTKADVSLYPQLPLALSLLHKFESDLYVNAIVPIALAHRYTAISLVPGGQVLDILTEQALGG